jgi:hypothetical protein
MSLSVSVRRTTQHDVLGMPDAYAICAKGAIPGIQSTQIIAVVWGKDIADTLTPMVREALANPVVAKKTGKKKSSKTKVSAEPESPAVSSSTESGNAA